jgi:cardiolipin synthase
MPDASPHKNRTGRTRTLKAVALTFLLTVAATVLVLNLGSAEKKIDEQVRHEYALRDAQYQRTLGVMLGPPITDGNRFEALYNGDRIFPPMLDAIRAAKQSITFETYIYWSGDIGRAFADALSERARAGVRVHVLLDWVGSAKVDGDFVKEMEAAGVQIRRFHKPTWYDIARMNNRTHRKLLVADGRIGFTGGVGIAPEWTGNAQDADHWRDSHYKVEGPVVAQMQAVFMDNWTKVSGDVLHGERYFPALRAVGNGRAQVFSSSPSGGSESMHLMYLLSIAAATKSIDLSSAYFVPDDLTVGALVAAMQRGVRLRIITPGGARGVAQVADLVVVALRALGLRLQDHGARRRQRSASGPCGSAPRRCLRRARIPRGSTARCWRPAPFTCTQPRCNAPDGGAAVGGLAAVGDGDVRPAGRGLAGTARRAWRRLPSGAPASTSSAQVRKPYSPSRVFSSRSFSTSTTSSFDSASPWGIAVSSSRK